MKNLITKIRKISDKIYLWFKLKFTKRMTLEEMYRNLCIQKDALNQSLFNELSKRAKDNFFTLVSGAKTNDELVLQFGQVKVTLIYTIMPHAKSIRIDSFIHERNLDIYPNWKLTLIPKSVVHVDETGYFNFTDIDVIENFVMPSGQVIKDVPFTPSHHINFGENYLNTLTHLLTENRYL